MSSNGLIVVLVSALGGQGGGVLADWLVAAARAEGFPAQATSIPGVAQRTGATTYLFEVWPHKDADASPVFSIYPAAGAVDLQVSFEPTEASRALMNGFVGPETTLITASQRIYSTSEKLLPGDGTIPLTPVLKALEACAGALKIVDVASAARGAKCHPNAVMFGVMAASGVLPFDVDACRKAVAGSGVAVAANLAGFDAGVNLPSRSIKETETGKETFLPAPEKFRPVIAALPEPLRDMAGHGVNHLCDYQDDAYGEQFLSRLNGIVGLDDAGHGYELSIAVARRLAAWMGFEDVVRVAQLKTRPGRFARIRQELSIGDDEPLTVHDYLKPGRDEFLGLLPASVAQRFADKTGGGMALKIKTSSPFGFAMMKVLASLKGWRRRSWRFAREQEMIDKWLAAVKQAAGEDYRLACEVADLAVWVRGYGGTRARGFAELETALAASPDKIAASLAAARAVPEAI